MRTLNSCMAWIAGDKGLSHFQIWRYVDMDLSRSIAELGMSSKFGTFLLVDVLNFHFPSSKHIC